MIRFPAYFNSLIVDGVVPVSQDAGVPAYIYAFLLGVFGSVTLALIYAGTPERLNFLGWIIFSHLLLSRPVAVGRILDLGQGFPRQPGLHHRMGAGPRREGFRLGYGRPRLSGLAGAMAVLVLGPTLRRAARGKESEIAYKELAETRHADLQLAIIGTILLFFGWFGLNGGSTLAVSAQTSYA